MQDAAFTAFRRRDEDLIRVDPVIVTKLSSTGVRPRTQTRVGLGVRHRVIMLITTQRVIFAVPEASWFERPLGWMFGVPLLNFIAMAVIQAPPAARDEWIELIDITRLWTWQPEFSAAPVIQASSESWSIALLVDSGRRASLAETPAVRDHFAALEQAWEAARTRKE